MNTKIRSYTFENVEDFVRAVKDRQLKEVYVRESPRSIVFVSASSFERFAFTYDPGRPIQHHDGYYSGDRHEVRINSKAGAADVLRRLGVPSAELTMLANVKIKQLTESMVEERTDAALREIGGETETEHVAASHAVTREVHTFSNGVRLHAEIEQVSRRGHNLIFVIRTPEITAEKRASLMMALSNTGLDAIAGSVEFV